ncbi:2-oxo-4-hydroxy-4-carboxy-5-ureidoimidazoline decarboxylase [Paenibacillus filicis]|uniref:2-oxo-4-hydroxy-4-carboxy-5-ureidoimidazoline decarboxylase n=1 Tax=Paenibacillus filicis TaxID=669464 RepID=A0ABU9DFG2_9BACL
MTFTIEEVNQMNREQFVESVGWVFEHSPWVAERAWPARPFASLEQLTSVMEEAVKQSSSDERLALLRSHPDLATKLKMTEASVGEQRSAGLHELSTEEFERLTAGIRAYRGKFGFPFIMAVRDQNRVSIEAALNKRLDGSLEDEKLTALQEVFKIVSFRLSDLILKPDEAGRPQP